MFCKKAAFPVVAKSNDAVTLIELHISAAQVGATGVHQQGDFQVSADLWVPECPSKYCSILNSIEFLSRLGSHGICWTIPNAPPQIKGAIFGCSLGIAFVVSAMFNIPASRAAFTGYVSTIGSSKENPRVLPVDGFKFKARHCTDNKVILVGNIPQKVQLIDETFVVNVNFVDELLRVAEVLQNSSSAGATLASECKQVLLRQ